MTPPLFNTLYLLSALSFLIASCTDISRSILWCVCTPIIALLMKNIPKRPFAHGKAMGILSLLGALLTAGTVVLNYGKLIRFTAPFDLLHSITGISTSLLQYAFAAVFAMGGVYFLWVTIEAALSVIHIPAEASNTDTRACLTKQDWAMCLAVAFVTITLVSRSSPLYPTNDWMDPNIFFTMGRGILEGMMPYRDLFEHKGTLLYLLHAMAAAISDTSFFGVYLIELAAAVGFMVYALKIMRLLRPGCSALWLPVLAAVVYSAPAFVMGDSVEELCLPLLAYCLYLGMDILQHKRELTVKECLLIGITSGCVLWIKFTILGFYIGWFLCYAIIRLREKNIAAIFKTAGTIAVGVAIATTPILIFHICTDTMADMWEVYFYHNLFSYTEASVPTLSDTPIFGLITGYLSFARFNILILGLVVLALINRDITHGQRLMMVCVAALMFLVIYVGNRRYIYYSFVFAVLAPVGLSALDSLLSRRSIPTFRGLPAAICIGCLLFTFSQSENTAVLGRTKADLPQYQFAEIINQVENPTLLNYRFLDGGFYTAAGILPNTRFFFTPNLPLPEITESQDKSVAEGATDFVVAHFETLPSDKYTRVAESTYWVEGEYRTFYLYQLTSEVN